MSTKTLKDPAISNTIFSKEYPIAFRVLNEKHEEKIYLEDKPSSGLLELTNTSDQDIYLAPRDLSEKAGPQNYHFAMKFRPGILKTTAKALIENKLIKKGWVLTIGLESLETKEIKDPDELKDKTQETLDEYISVLYFLNIHSAKISSGKTITLPLKHLHLQCDEGTQVTKVELTCNNLSHDKEFNTTLKAHERHYNLTIINHRGNPHMPLNIDFTGFNAILNNGSSNKMNLRITNLQKQGSENKGTFTISRKKHSRIYLYFNTDIQSNDFALGTPNNISEIKLSTTLPPQKKSSFLVHEPFHQGDNPVWELYPEAGDVVLQPHLVRSKNTKKELPDDSSMDTKKELPDDSSMDINLDIKTSFMMGVTHLYLRFENIPGYWDHTFAIPIVKQPLIFYTTSDNEEHVGIGTPKPKAKLGVTGGDIGVDEGNQNDGKAHYGIKFGGLDSSVEFIGSKRTAGGNQYGLDFFTKGETRLSISNDGNVGIGISWPAKKRLEVNNAMKFTSASGNPEDGVIGNAPSGSGLNIVGINTDSQGRKISIAGSIIQSENSLGNNFAGNSEFGGNVGIGVQASTSKLSINAGNYDGLQINTNPNAYALTIGGHGAIRVLASDNSGARFTVRENGNVGIGVSVPDAKLAIWGGVVPGLKIENNANVPALSIGSHGDVNIDRPGVVGGRFTIKDNGCVGIFADKPTKAMLEIGIGNTYEFRPIGGIGKLQSGTYTANFPTTTNIWGNSIWADGRVVAESFLVPSDLRIKKLMGKSDSREDLETIKKIEITNYQMKDAIVKSDRQQKKVIAQQLKDVYPQAVSQTTNIIPDIYQTARLGDQWVKVATNLVVGEKVQLAMGPEKKTLEVLETNEEGFKVSADWQGDVFVYGREVDDFLSVDYDAISMLNVSATQELAKQIETLKEENRQLKNELTDIKKKMSGIIEMFERKMELTRG